jgi:hypothetical protein
VLFTTGIAHHLFLAPHLQRWDPQHLAACTRSAATYGFTTLADWAATDLTAWHGPFPLLPRS